MLAAHARQVPANARAALAEAAQRSRPAGSVVLITCHRVEIYGPPAVLDRLAATQPWHAANLQRGTQAARHLVRVAIGLDSAIVAEDQIVHQLRAAAQDARARADLSPELDRLLDTALRAGRQARSWLPAQRASLPDLALERMVGHDSPGHVLVVGSGEMGQLAAAAVIKRGGQLSVTSRTPERAAALAERHGASATAFSTEAHFLAGVDGVIVALRGDWPLAAPALAALRASGAWLIDLSAPPALPSEVCTALGPRLLTIDDLGTNELSASSARPVSSELRARLEALAERATADFLAWVATARRRGVARALEGRAAEIERIALEQLWQRAPTLSGPERLEIERALRHVTHDLLRGPIERLREDRDGTHARAARELFRL